MEHEKNLDQRLERKGVSRRDFLKYCTVISATLGLSSSFVPKIAEAIANPKRPPVVWLPFAECTGCAETTLRTAYPWIDQLVLDIISLDYHETIMAPSGEAAEKSLHDTVTKYPGQFICIVDGAIPTAENGVYGMIGGRTMIDI
ncbi:MAG: twin-arginine translocation signal domain-containing protein, partial [Desulfobacteraceae bacterium]|nr:twin-arginine translocation signal domain-containing protein [Desulfobacteraceae bacterium]